MAFLFRRDIMQFECEQTRRIFFLHFILKQKNKTTKKNPENQ